MKELDGKRALVTGGTKGIGKAVVAWLRAAGATVLTTAREGTGDGFIAAEGEHRGSERERGPVEGA